MKSKNYEIYFCGERLYGDDFSLEEIQRWYEDEKEGYANLGAKDASAYEYGYHQLNKILGYHYLPNKTFENVLGFGSAYGDELIPIAQRINRVTILDASEKLRKPFFEGVSLEYKLPKASGQLEFSNETFDLVVSLGVLHHVPNVSYVLSELFRCTKKGGYALIREPIVSMGDWRMPRAGLTKRERGIPSEIFDSLIRSTGYEVCRKTFCVFPVIPMFGKWVGPVYNRRAFVYLDILISRALSFNRTYHRTKLHQKFGPTAVYYVLKKRD